MSNRIIVREKMKPLKEATQEDKDIGLQTVLEEINSMKPDSMIILYHNKNDIQAWGNIIHGEFSVGILKELTKEFENAYGEIIKRSVIVK